MPHKKEKTAQLDRRSLLKGAGFAIGAAGASVATTAAGVVVFSGVERKAKHMGYRETKDVLTYYKAARD
ncbi:MAG: hypothetical protein ACREB8_17780 [Pseudolabrys sp.]